MQCCLGGGYLINKSYAVYQESVSFKVMEGTVQYEGSGDVFFAFYNGGQQLDEMPKKGAGIYFEHAECNNGASVEWNSSKWAPTVTNLTKTKTKCTLYFSESAGNYNQIEELMKKNPSMIAYDDTSEQNLRYIGASPYNYIDIGDRDSDGNKILWRIIGVMKNIPVVDEYGEISNTENLVKIIRADSIGSYSWDSSGGVNSGYEVNNGYGVNEWSQADLMTTLNSGAYWRKTSGQCYSSSNNKQKACDFSSIGLTKEVRNKLAKVRWNTGTIPDEFSSNTSKITASYMYQGERSDNHGKKFCSTGSYCNDQVNRTTTWDGYIGLMYPSDYGYAVGGSVRTECLAKTMYNWDGSIPDCKGNNWLIDSYQWTLTPVPYSSFASYVFVVYSGGCVRSYDAYDAEAVRPTAYLKSSIKIQEKSASDYGSKSNPFVLEGVS